MFRRSALTPGLCRKISPVRHSSDSSSLISSRIARCSYGPHLVLALHEQQIQIPVMFEDDGTLGFGGMRREHELDAHARQRGGDRVRRDARVERLLQAVSPERLHRGEAALGFRLALLLHGGVLLDEAEQVKRDRICLQQALGRNVARGVAPVSAPGQAACQRSLARLVEHLAEALHQEGEVAFDLLRIERENGRKNHGVLDSFLPDARKQSTVLSADLFIDTL